MCRTRMIDIKCNFKNKHQDNLCPNCKSEEDSQPHLLTCPKLDQSGTVMIQNAKYEDLFSDNLLDQINICRILKAKFQTRKELDEKHTK